MNSGYTAQVARLDAAAVVSLASAQPGWERVIDAGARRTPGLPGRVAPAPAR